MIRRSALCCAVLCFCFTAIAFAQDAVKADPAHYKIESENAKVRILRVHYGPHEKSVMHSHPDSVAVFLTDGSVRFTLPGGKTQDSTVKAGQAQYTPAQVHDPENIGDTSLELVLIEFKSHAAKAAVKPAADK
ncbi:MAG: cupin domain-containing protein [Terriglobales bacterium]